MSVIRCDQCSRQIDTDDDAECVVGDEILCESCRDDVETKELSE
jgi:hypothetical protein